MMKRSTKGVIALLWLLPLLGALGTAHAFSLDISDQNSALKVTIDDPGANVNSPSDPLQLPRALEWRVDGRRILVYPSSPATMFDIGHIHFGAHVGPNQIHEQGPLLGFATGGPMGGSVTGGIVYTVEGGPAGSGRSRIVEKVDVHNKTANAINVSLSGMGYKSPQANLEVPDLTGLELAGTTVVFSQGSTGATSITDPPFGPLKVLPVTTFTGFNPLLNQSFSLPAGGMLTLVTEIKVSHEIRLVARPWFWAVLAVVVLMLAVGVPMWRRRSRG